VLVLEEQEGVKYELFKHVYQDGQLVDTVRVNTSMYRPLQGVVHVGE
jgi:hypothetical protein